MTRTARVAKNLPDPIEALFFACHCFSLSQKRLEDCREKLSHVVPGKIVYPMYLHRAKTRNPISRTELNRARGGHSISRENREHFEDFLQFALHEHFQVPDPGVNFFCAKLVEHLLGVYHDVHENLDSHRIAKRKLLWLISEHVLLPTAFATIRNYCHQDLGAEFRGADCWYLPTADGNGVKKPVQRVLDYFMRIAGLTTDGGFNKRFGSESDRRRFKRWLKGENPNVDGLHNLVKRHSVRVQWLDHPDLWRARFTLAAGAQCAWNSADEFFKEAGSSLKLARIFGELAMEPILNDKRGFLVIPNTFFMSRLLQARLGREGRMEEILASADPGDFLLENIKEQAIAAGHLARRHNIRQVLAAISTLGHKELNRLIHEDSK